MAIRPDDAATLAKGLREQFAEAETLLLQKIAKALSDGGEGPDWAERKLRNIQALRAQTDRIIARLQAGLPGALEEAIGLAYNRGIATAGGELTKAGLVHGAFAEVQPTGAVTALVTETMDRLRPMAFQISRAVNDIYSQVVRQAVAQTTLGVLTRREASGMILEQLGKAGINGFRDAAGRQWNMASYAEMAARSATSNAMLQGHTDRIQELGIDTVIINDSPEECRICRPFEGRVLSLSGRTTGRLKDGRTVMCSLSDARSKGLFHNNCRHSHSIYLPGITKPMKDTADPEGDALRQKQRAFERRVRELKREQAIAKEFGGPAATQATAKLRAKQAEMKAWIEANDRKTLAYRTSLVAR